MTHKEFVRAFPEMKGFPEFIIGEGNKRIRLMDARYADLQHYQRFLERRIARRERLTDALRRRQR